MSSAKTKQGKIKTVEANIQDPLWGVLENFVDLFEKKKQTIIYAALGVIGVVIIGSIIYGINSYQKGKAQEAFSKALEIYNAEVIKPGTTENVKKSQKTYLDEKQKYKEAAEAFDRVAADHSSVATPARYYAALSRTHFDATKAQTELEQLSKQSSEVSDLAKMALAESYIAANQLDKAIETYKQMKEGSAKLSKSLIFYNIGRLYERQGKTKEAVDQYFQAASTDASSEEGRRAKDRLESLDPETAKKLPPEKKEESDI